MINNILTKELTQEKLNDYVIVDVRTDEEYNSGYLESSLHIPHDQMQNRYTEIENYKNDSILLVCRSGYRSMLAAEVLQNLGFEKLYNMAGGMLEWQGEIKQPEIT